MNVGDHLGQAAFPAGHQKLLIALARNNVTLGDSHCSLLFMSLP
jgi:hypothetical protein